MTRSLARAIYSLVSSGHSPGGIAERHEGYQRRRAVAIAFAKEGADISVIYLEERKDANETKRLVEENGSKCLLIEGDVGQEEFCRKAVNQTMKDFGRLDVVVNNAAEQHPQD